MKLTIPFLTGRFCVTLGALLLLSSCAPAPGITPSTALKEQLNAIRQQQQQQALQLQQLQQQLATLQQQLPAGTTQAPATPPPQTEETVTTTDTFIAPPPADQMNGNQTAVHIAASASSYLEAFSNLAAGNAAAAESGFQAFLRDFPDHQYAPNARYWLATAQLSQGKSREKLIWQSPT